MTTALITGVTGQDGFYLSQFLVKRGYLVHGMARRSGRPFADVPTVQGVLIHQGDMTDPASIRTVMERVQPDEVYNLAAQSHVGASFHEGGYTFDVDALGVHRILKCIRKMGLSCRFYQASSSELFGNEPGPLSETSKMMPRSDYAIAKLAAFHMTRLARERADFPIFAVNGILFNHESQKRVEHFVTRKITRGVGRIKFGLQRAKIQLGNPGAARDWGYAGDYVEAMWMMLQAERPDDYVVATGESHTVLEFVREAFRLADLDWREWVEFEHPLHLRAAEVDHLRGDASKIKRELGWEPKVKFDGLVKLMVEADLKLAEREAGAAREDEMLAQEVP